MIEEIGEKDDIYKTLADGHPKVIMELNHRACIHYPTMSEFVLVTISRYQTNKSNTFENVRDWIYNTMDGLALRDSALEFELQNAYNKNWTKKQIILQVMLDLMATRDEGMPENIKKYDPLIRIEEGHVHLTDEAKELFY